MRARDALRGLPPTKPLAADAPAPDALSAYLVDTAQRTILYWDVMRRRGNQYLEHMAQKVPNVLHFGAELVLAGSSLARPVNYGLVRIVPPEGVTVDPKKRPFVVIDPRAGHGPGIGGFKPVSQIGVALAAGHPCYFIGFLPQPVPGQTIEDVMEAEAAFLAKVISLHPQADGRPVVIGNCQGGWATMMLAAAHPDLVGPVIVAGAPLSYWNGVRGKAPMRYSGGLLGGSWLTALTGDLGGGIFDGAYLVENFEGMNPANTYWTKQYNLYSKIDTEAERYLGFEVWWGGHVLLNAGEMQWIVDNLFVGNRLATAEIVTADGIRLDLRSIKTPIICLCSHGDDITPPPQALGWILDLYGSVDDIRANGQTIVYCVHDKIGHLGIFVSASVAKKEHAEFANNIDFIDCLPPGLYEAVITPTVPGTAPDGLAVGDYVARFELRTLDDIRAIGANDAEDERRFAAVARLSEINLGLYRTFLQPWLRAMVTPQAAELMRRMHPLRLGFELVSDQNPLTAGLTPMADWVRQHRQPADPGNPFLAWQEMTSEQIVAGLDAWRDLRDASLEAAFHMTYGSPLVQALLGLRASDAPPRPRPGQEPEEAELIREHAEALRRRIGEGGLREAFVRALIYVRLPGLAADERGFHMLQRLRDEHAADMSLADFKALFRDQFLMVLHEPEAAVAALPRLLAGHEAGAPKVLALLESVLAVGGPLLPESERRLRQVAEIFAAVPPEAKGRRRLTVAGGSDAG
ncbi:MAG: DUF3141 domain-containing protein [Geminicoccaceae bacterium]